MAHLFVAMTYQEEVSGEQSFSLSSARAVLLDRSLFFRGFILCYGTDTDTSSPSYLKFWTRVRTVVVWKSSPVRVLHADVFIVYRGMVLLSSTYNNDRSTLLLVCSLKGVLL